MVFFLYDKFLKHFLCVFFDIRGDNSKFVFIYGVFAIVLYKKY